MSASRDRSCLFQVPFDPRQYDQFRPYIDYGYLQFSNRMTSKTNTYDGRADELNHCIEQEIDPPELPISFDLLHMQLKLLKYYSDLDRAVEQISRLIGDLTPHNSDDFDTPIRTLQVLRNIAAGIKITIEKVQRN
jgi:hypothetical protein